MTMDIKRLQNESLTDFKIRICSNKAILNLTWKDVADVINKETGQTFGESAYRKWFNSFNDGLEYANENNVTDSEAIQELKEKTKDFEIAKIQYQDQTREYRALLRHEARLDNLLKKMLDSIKDEINTNKPLEWVKPIYHKGSKGALTLLLSDLHRGMKTDNHWNKYDEDIFYERLNQVTQEVLEYKKLTNADEIHVFELGDAISGSIHRMTKIKETENAVESTQKVAEALSELLSVLSNSFSQVHYYNVKGNHDRVAARKEEEVRTESFHSFIVWYMKARLENHKNIVFHDNELDSEIIVAEIKGNYYFGVHGHLDSLGKVVQDLTMMTRKFAKAIFMGHYHRNYENEIHGVDLIMNGSFGGTDDYAKDVRLTSKAHQKLLWLDENGRKATFYLTFNK
ncbi:metallophosphoesterase [Lederbergia citrisecunda]|uniref:metallophosphoesterase n=1 Tax=Lederbergia citrisecunda TaxID=2833583 RepID=UPI003D2AF2FD